MSRRFDQHHTHYQGTAFRLKFQFLLILQYSWNRDKTIKYYNQIILLYKETIKKLTIVKKNNLAELMLLFKLGLFRLISKLSLFS